MVTQSALQNKYAAVLSHRKLARTTGEPTDLQRHAPQRVATASVVGFVRPSQTILTKCVLAPHRHTSSKADCSPYITQSIVATAPPPGARLLPDAASPLGATPVKPVASAGSDHTLRGMP